MDVTYMRIGDTPEGGKLEWVPARTGEWHIDPPASGFHTISIGAREGSKPERFRQVADPRRLRPGRYFCDPDAGPGCLLFVRMRKPHSRLMQLLRRLVGLKDPVVVEFDNKATTMGRVLKALRHVSPPSRPD